MKYLLPFLLAFSLYGKMNYSYKDYVDAKSYPEISFSNDKNLKKLVVTIKRDNKKYIVKKYKNLKANINKKIVLKQDFKEHSYSLSFKGVYKNKNLKPIDESLEMKGLRIKPLNVKFTKENVDVEGSKLIFSANRDIKKVEVKIYDIYKKLTYQNEINYNKLTKNNIKIEWEKPKNKILSIQIVAYDKFGFWAGMEINPFSVDIPHKEVVFSSGKWNIEKKQIYKIKDSYKQVKKALDKYGKALELRLYIAGYTDSVGDSKNNLILSQNRAKSIAKAFRKMGLHISIYYQGFGEDVLKVKTKDEVDEVQNRRAIYILSSHKPEKCKTIPKDHWVKLR